ncbi:MAG: tyrosine-type recombinase/integrase [Candidatus Paceibacterota bacterium]
MASLQQEPTGTFHVTFRFAGRRFKRSLQTKSRSKAETRRDEIQETVELIKRGRLSVPESVAAADFIMADGDATKLVEPEPREAVQKAPTLQSLCDHFFESIPPASIEESTLKTMRIHERHLLRVLGPNLTLASITSQRLQGYVNTRACEPTKFIADKSKPLGKQNRTTVSATTIRKEIRTLGAMWRWAMSVPLVERPFPNGNIRWPKTDEKPPFQTWAEIERQIEQGSFTSSEEDMLWDCLYLRSSEIDDLLDFVRCTAADPFIYPCFAMSAYTGARRSELLRSERTDFDLEGRFVAIRERKRVKGKRSTRRVPLSPKLTEIMRKWLAQHPGGPWTFVKQSPYSRKQISSISVNQAQNAFRTTVDGGKWKRLKGWHCLRHSFISNLACAGIDQRIIDEFAGHTTEEMRRRYRHLFPNVKQAAIERVFG